MWYTSYVALTASTLRKGGESHSLGQLTVRILTARLNGFMGCGYLVLPELKFTTDLNRLLQKNPEYNSLMQAQENEKNGWVSASPTLVWVPLMPKYKIKTVTRRTNHNLVKKKNKNNQDGSVKYEFCILWLWILIPVYTMIWKTVFSMHNSLCTNFSYSSFVK